MKFSLWLAAFLAALVIEFSVLPRFFGAMTPSITLPVMLLGIAFQRLGPGLAFAGLAGLSRDIVAGGGANTFVAFGTVAVIHGVLRFTGWEESLGRISAVGAGLALHPFLRFAGDRLSGLLWATNGSVFAWPGLTNGPALRGLIFTLLWFTVFSWLTIRAESRGRAHRLRHL